MGWRYRFERVQGNDESLGMTGKAAPGKHQGGERRTQDGVLSDSDVRREGEESLRGPEGNLRGSRRDGPTVRMSKTPGQRESTRAMCYLG